MATLKLLKQQYLEYLNSHGSPIIKTYFNRTINKNIIKKHKYGNWLRSHNKVLFDSGFNEWLLKK
jgi:hypothetical protein